MAEMCLFSSTKNSVGHLVQPALVGNVVEILFVLSILCQSYSYSSGGISLLVQLVETTVISELNTIDLLWESSTRSFLCSRSLEMRLSLVNSLAM